MIVIVIVIVIAVPAVVVVVEHCQYCRSRRSPPKTAAWEHPPVLRRDRRHRRQRYCVICRDRSRSSRVRHQHVWWIEKSARDGYCSVLLPYVWHLFHCYCHCHCRCHCDFDLDNQDWKCDSLPSLKMSPKATAAVTPLRAYRHRSCCENCCCCCCCC